MVVCLEVIVFKSMLVLHIVNKADAIKMRRTYEAGGKQEATFRMCTKTSSCLIRMQKLRKSLALVELASIGFQMRIQNLVFLDETIGNFIEMMKTFVLPKNFPTNICKRLPESSCVLVLGKALLWLIYSNDAISNNFACSFLESSKIGSKTIYLKYSQLRVPPPVEDGRFNPIWRVPVVASGDQESIFIDTVDGFVEQC